MIRQILITSLVATPVLGIAQISVFNANYRLEADARSGPAFDSQIGFSNGTGPVQVFSRQIDAFANQLPSTVHSYASTTWNCAPFSLTAGVVACWNSVDMGAGNSAHLFGRLSLSLRLTAVNSVSISAAFDPSNSSMEIDAWTGTGWTLLVNSTQIANYSSIWNPGDYRLRAQRQYNPVGSSTGCVPLSFGMQLAPVPEPSGMLALIAGVGFLGRRRK